MSQLFPAPVEMAPSWGRDFEPEPSMFIVDVTVESDGVFYVKAHSLDAAREIVSSKDLANTYTDDADLKLDADVRWTIREWKRPVPPGEAIYDGNDWADA